MTKVKSAFEITIEILTKHLNLCRAFELGNTVRNCLITYKKTV